MWYGIPVNSAIMAANKAFSGVKFENKQPGLAKKAIFVSHKHLGLSPII